MILSMLFGITSSVRFLFLWFGRRLLIGALQKDPSTMIRMPTEEEVITFQNPFASKNILLHMTFTLLLTE